MEHVGKLQEIVGSRESDVAQGTGMRSNQRRQKQIRVLKSQALQMGLLLEGKPRVTGLRDP